MTTALLINFITVLFAFGARKGPAWLMTISQLFLSFCYGIRYDYGNDYWNYYEIFLNCSGGFNPEIIEPGWGIINVACQPIGFMGMVFLLTAFEYYVVYSHIRHFIPQKYWWIAVLIFTFTFNFQLLGCSMMRQYLAMTILLYSVKYIASRNLIRFFLVIAIAISIHKTAIIFIPTYILGGKFPDIKKVRWVVIYSALFLFLLAVSIKYIEYFQIAAVIFDDEKFSRYLMGDEGSYSFTIIFDILWLILLMRTCPDDKIRKVLCLISIVSYAMLPFTFVVVMLLRLMLFFSFFFIFSIPNMFVAIKKPLIRYGLLGIYIILMVKRSITSITGETYGNFYDTFLTIFSAPAWI